MMTDLAGKLFFERAVTVHRPDCAFVALAGEPSEAAETATTAIDEAEIEAAVVRYVVAIRPVYDGLRRLIGHLAGLLVLVQAAGRRDLFDLPDLAAARERWHEAEAGLGSVEAPHRLREHLARLRSAHSTLGAVLDDFASARRQPDWPRHVDRASDRIKLAYAALQAASEPRAGMTPVEFNHACCSCSQRWRQEGGKNGPVFDLGARI